MLLFMSKFFSQSLNLFDVTSRAPNTTRTTTTCDKFQIFFIFRLSSLQLSTFLFFQLNPFVPRHRNINKVTLSFNFVQHNYVRPSAFNDMVCLDIKISQYLDPAIFSYFCRFVIIQLNLAN